MSPQSLLATPAPRPPDRNDVKIALVGAPGSGKTTYLAALAIAASHESKTGIGSWSIRAGNKESRIFKTQLKRRISEELKFPEGTTGAGIKLDWLFSGNLAGSKFDHRLRFRRDRPLLGSFVLDLVDAPGADYLRDPGDDEAAEDNSSIALDHLRQAEGIIYLFDPIRERKKGDSSAYLTTLLDWLEESARENGKLDANFFTHQISVCVTKFDDPDVLERANIMRLVRKGGESEIPRVPDDKAEQLFESLCNGKFWGESFDAGGQSASYFLNDLRGNFNPSRIRYFVTSSIGFWMQPAINGHPNPWIDRADPSNCIPGENETTRLRGKVNPVNVLEPLIDLQRRIVRDRR